MKVFLVAILGVLILSGAGCTKLPQPAVLPDEPSRASINLDGDVMITSVEIHKEFVLNEYAECKIDISYPYIESTELNPEVAILFDDKVLNFVAQALGRVEKIDGSDDLNPIADNYLESCQQQITTEYNDLAAGGEELFMNLKHTIEIIFVVSLNQDNLLSLGLDEYSYTGGAHPSDRLLYLNIDRTRDTLLTLSDVIADDQLKSFVQLEKTKLLTVNYDTLYPESTEEFEAIIADTETMSAEEQLTAYGNLDNFYLTPTSIVTYYNSYDLAPYYVGPITVDLPYADIKNFIDPTGPLAPIVEKL